MNVAVVYHFFPHYRAAVMRELLRSPEHQYLLVGDDGAVEPSIRNWNVEPAERFLRAPCIRLPGNFLLQKGLLRLALQRDLDAVIYLGNPYYLSTWLSALLARLAGKRVFFWTHGWTRKESGLKAWIRCAFYRLSHGLMLYGHMAKAEGIEKGFRPERMHVIYNSLDYDAQKKAREAVTATRLETVRRELFPGPSRPIVVCSARLTAQCQFDLLIKAQAVLATQGHSINVLLIGEGPEQPALQELARKLSVPVRFYGACYDNARLAELIMAASVTVSPGKVGLTAMQSLAYGTPVITHNDFYAQMPEWEAIVQGRSGDFFRRNDVDDLARIIKAWTRTSEPDPSLRMSCADMLERFYNPRFQRRAIERALNGRPADDLFWMKEDLCAA